MKKVYLGLDLSMSSAGIAVIEVTDGKPELVEATEIKTKAKNNHGTRLHTIALGLRDTMRVYEPFDTVIREQGFSRFAKTTQTLFKVVGISDFMLRDYAIKEIAPTTVKKLVSPSKNGRAGKDEVEQGVRRILNLPESYKFNSDDASDAVAVILAHLIQIGTVTNAEE